MRILKKIFVFILILVALILVAGLFIPKKYTVTASISINKPQQEVYDYLRLLKNQEAYSEWVKADPKNKPIITGTDGQVGAKQSWDGPEAGAGEQIITQININRIDVDLIFKKPFEGQSKASTILKATSPTQTQVTAEFYADETYPNNIMSYLVGRPMIEDTENKNLQNIKQILEK